MNWPATKAHFDEIRQQYKDLENMPGCNTRLALALLFQPLLDRYDAGERSQTLHDEMLAVQ